MADRPHVRREAEALDEGSTLIERPCTHSRRPGSAEVYKGGRSSGGRLSPRARRRRAGLRTSAGGVVELDYGVMRRIGSRAGREEDVDERGSQPSPVVHCVPTMKVS